MIEKKNKGKLKLLWKCPVCDSKTQDLFCLKDINKFLLAADNFSFKITGFIQSACEAFVKKYRNLKKQEIQDIFIAINYIYLLLP